MNEVNDFLLARNPDFKISHYNRALAKKTEVSKIEIAEAIQRRLLQRYILPCKNSKNKNGFNIMANCCLLIETIESFYRGWSKTPNGSDAFCKFFNRELRFNDFTGNDMPTQFYKKIRCGILHQGETQGGWRIRRDQKSKLDLEQKIIDANKFRDDLENCIIDYFKELKTKKWDSHEWRMLIKKMKFIIKNCQN